MVEPLDIKHKDAKERTKSQEENKLMGEPFETKHKDAKERTKSQEESKQMGEPIEALKNQDAKERTIEHKDAKERTIEALKNQDDWKDVRIEDLEFEEISGLGGAKTFKVTNKVGAVVILKEFRSDTPDFLVNKIQSFMKILASRGLGPRQLAQGHKWYIAEYIQEEKPKDVNKRYESYGALIAKFHETPTDWFDDVRDFIIQEKPKFASIDSGSHSWVYASRIGPNHSVLQNAVFLSMGDELFRQYSHPREVMPQTTIAKRVVTLHGDFHEGNIIAKEDGSMAVDFEWVSVGFAAFDLSTILLRSGGDIFKKTAFLRGYLKQLGQPHEESDINTLMVDALIFGLTNFHRGGNLDMMNLFCSEIEALKTIQQCQNIAQDIRKSDELQAILCSDGLNEAMQKKKPKRLKLVELGSIRALRFPKDLSAIGKTVGLQCDDGWRIMGTHEGYKWWDGWRYIKLVVKDTSEGRCFAATFDGECITLKLQEHLFALDVDCGNIDLGTTCGFVVDKEPQHTKNTKLNPGRRFVINSDRTISPYGGPEYVLGY